MSRQAHNVSSAGAPIPYIRVERLGSIKCRTLAKLLKVPSYAGRGLGQALWEFGVDSAPIGVDGLPDLSGHLPENAAELVAAAVEWDGDPEQLWRAFVTVGLCEPAQGKTPARIKGLKRYLAVFKERERDRDRKRNQRNGTSNRVSGRKSGGTPPGVPGVEEDLDLDRSSKEEGPVLPITSVASPAAPSSVGFFSWMRSTRVRLHPELKEESPPPQITLDRLADAERQVGRDELERRYRTYLEVEYWASGRPPWHANGFAKNWHSCPPAPKQLPLEPGPAHPLEFLELLQHVREAGESYLATHLATCRASVIDSQLVLNTPDPFFAKYLGEGLQHLLPDWATRVRIVSPEAS